MQEAVNIVASSQGQIDTIKIAKGTYSPSSLPRGINMFEFFDYNNERTFDLPGNLVVMGGYSSGGSTRNPELFETILSSTTYHVVSVAYTPNVLLDGLTIKNGNANGPGNAYVNGLPRPRNNGGGILALNTSLVLKNCKISNNTTTTYGGGLTCSASLLTIRDCLISDNYGGEGAGGLYLLRCKPDQLSGNQHLKTLPGNSEVRFIYGTIQIFFQSIVVCLKAILLQQMQAMLGWYFFRLWG